ncbi:MAG: hypothetical protein NVV74_25630 [Magnetospirillum sp.]|nr:hypothetical protein [Magnetospirillum sp.]
MDLNMLAETLSALVPGAQFSIWDGEPPFPPESDPSTVRETRMGFVVCWNHASPAPCPGEDEIAAARRLVGGETP